MKKLLEWVGAFFLVVVITMIHFIVITFTSSPWNSIHLILASLFCLLIITAQKPISALAMALIFGFCVELFASTPFGLVSFALLISVIVVSFLLNTIFTNRSILIVFFSGVVGTASYYIILTIGIMTQAFFYKTNFIVTTEFVERAGISILTTSLFFIISYSFISRFTRRLNPRYISGATFTL
ncbi:MAG: hypothetical protein EXS55_02145 [Candidatus Magasanikbacteria bacterium]|nr:hypothetical protein [Candidatus Magasanikbacteria bacterium]